MPLDEYLSAGVQRLFGYLSQPCPGPLIASDGAIVFGRHDASPALLVQHLVQRKMVRDWVVFTGGKKGKDSGALEDVDLAEADFHYAVATAGKSGLTRERCGEQFLFRETAASNGGENCRNSIGLVEDNQLPFGSVILVAHPTSMWRLKELFLTTIEDRLLCVRVQWAASPYRFDPSDPADAREAADEMLRLYNWPLRSPSWLRPQPDLPGELVTIARQIKAALPA